jgi:hypothetical protein
MDIPAAAIPLILSGTRSRLQARERGKGQASILITLRPHLIDGVRITDLGWKGIPPSPE